MNQHFTEIVPFEKGIFVEVVIEEGRREELSKSKLPSKLGEGLAVLRTAIQAVACEAAEAIKQLRHQFDVPEIEIEVGLGITAEGNVYVVKGTSSANFKVKFSIKLDKTEQV
jgi:hypothetical protein